MSTRLQAKRPQASKFSEPSSSALSQRAFGDRASVASELCVGSSLEAEDSEVDLTADSRDLKPQSSLTQALRLGHSFGRVQVDAPSPPIVQTKLDSINESATQVDTLNIQRQTVCDASGACWEEEDNASYPEPIASYPTLATAPDPNVCYPEPIAPSAPTATPTPASPSPAPPTAAPSADSGWSLFDNPLWNTVTNNAVSGATALFEAVNPISMNMPNFENALIRMGGVRGWDAALKTEDMLSYPAAKLPGVFGASGSIPGSSLPSGMSRASAFLAPIGAISNAMSFEDAIARPGSWLEKGGDAVSSGAGFFSSAVGTVGLAGAGLEAAGATTVGGALSAGAAGLGPAAAVAGAGAGGYALGRLADEAVGGLMNLTGASNLIDSWRGISRPEGQHGDYSITGIGADLATGLDQGVVSLGRKIGLMDESKPEYTQTLGWWLADHLPAWMQ